MGKYEWKKSIPREFEAFQIFEEIQRPAMEEEPAMAGEYSVEEEPIMEEEHSVEEEPAMEEGIFRESGQPGKGVLPGGERIPRGKTAPLPKPVPDVVPEEAPYYEIEYDACPMPGVGKFVLRTDRSRESQGEEISAGAREAARESDPVRERFNRMRDIARESRVLAFGNSRFYDKRIQQENSRLFYRQGMFMKDFEDDCERVLPYSAYFPNYQMMGYGQLRTYFTWRTQVRQGNIQQTSTSYAFLYIYELLNNIGVEGPEEGLERLMLFWDAYRVYDASLDKYAVKWLKDYHIYYELPRPFREFIGENGLQAYYPKLADPEDKFDLYCAISKYDIRKSNFYTEENRALVQDCFYFTMDRLRKAFNGCHADLEEYIFQPTRSMAAWTPFQGALFYPAARQADRRVVLSEKEVYLCSQNRWTFSAMITTESGKRLLGYCLKQMESVLRRLTKYKHKLTANPDALSPVMADELRKDGISLEETVTAAVEEFYREATKTVVKVDNASLEKIRQEALATQERLIVPEEPLQTAVLSGKADSGQSSRDDGEISGREQPAEMGQLSGADNSQARERESLYGAMPGERKELSGNGGEMSETAQESSGNSGSASLWDSLKEALSETERKALRLVAEGETNLKPFADGQGVMLEVLMDGINEKAMDSIGDSILDDGFELYDDYREQVKEMVESL